MTTAEEPRMTQPCPCPDFEAIDGDSNECACGHVEDEHEAGFFRACTIGAESNGGV